MQAWTSGSRSNSAVPVVRVKSAGARTDGEGDGSEVRCGFWERAASSGALLAGGVTRVISMSVSYPPDDRQSGSLLEIPIL
jgi:hypothetical protein